MTPPERLSASARSSEELWVQLGVLPDETSQRAFLAEHPELVAAETVGALAEAVRTNVRVDLPKAVKQAAAAVAIAACLEEDEPTGRALRAKANTAWFMGDYRSAVELFEQAAGAFERAGNPGEVARTISSSLQSLMLLGDYETALQSARRAREIFTHLGDKWRLARLELNLANILHRQNRYTEALHAYERAYQELLNYKDAEGIGVALHNMAVCLIALDDFAAANEIYVRARQLCNEHGMPLLAGQADYNIAYLFYLRGEYSKTLEMLRETKESCRRNGDNYHLGLCDLDQSDIYLELNFIEEAAEVAQASLDQFEKLGTNYEITRSKINLALALSLQGCAREALELLESAKGMAEREQNQVLPSLVDLYRAIVHFEQGDLKQAQQFCEQALSFFESAALPSKHVSCRLLLGRIRLASGDSAGAAIECDRALEIVKKLDSPILLYQSQFLRGQIFEASGDSEAAFDRYLQARAALETLRSSLQGDELKIGFMRNRIGVYERLVRLCMNRGRGKCSAEEAFLFVESAKARTLQDLILSRPQSTHSDADPYGTEGKIANLRKELNWYYHLIEREQYAADAISETRFETLKTQSLARERELCRALLEAPKSGAVGGALETSRTINIAEIRSVLENDSTLLEYFAIEGQIYAGVLTSNDLQIVPAGRASEVTQHLRMLRFQLSKFQLDRAYVQQFEAVLLKATQQHLRALYEDLIGPVEDLIRGQNLVIVPYGPLHSLPFQALFDGERYVIDRFSICYEPSAAIFAYSHRQRPTTAGPSLILGIDDPEMPFIKQEVEAVAKMLPEPLVLWGAEATETALRRYGADSRIIHIASHGYFRPDNAMFSAIRLADSYLTLHDLYRMNLPAEFLTLSGCVTGMDVVDQGDELIGLSRGLLYAGAQSLLLSLWEVDDQSTSDFMTFFYSKFGKQRTKAQVVRAATLETKEHFPHPYYWAAFKLIGRAFN